MFSFYSYIPCFKAIMTEMFLVFKRQLSYPCQTAVTNSISINYVNVGLYYAGKNMKLSTDDYKNEVGGWFVMER